MGKQLVEQIETPAPGFRKRTPNTDFVGLEGVVSKESMSSDTMINFTSLGQDILHKACQNFDHTSRSASEVDEAARILAEQDDFDNVNIEDQAHAASDEWFMDDFALPAIPEWLDAEQLPQPKSENVKHHETVTNAVYDQLVAAAESCTPLSQISGNLDRTEQHQITKIEDSENEFPVPEFDTSLIDLAIFENAEAATPQRRSEGPVAIKSKKLSQKPRTSSKPPQPIAPPKTPAAPYKLQFNPAGDPTPFVRKPFPRPILDQSPIHGLVNNTVLRTVFRVGEALNAASTASNSNVDAVVELYARVIQSSRMDYKQHFFFTDLFTDHPPYLRGTYGLWKDAAVWEQDSGVFLGEEGKGKVCRVIGRIWKGSSRAVQMNILSIWQCSYEDVGIAKGLVCS